jgi:hypothetical protein
LSPALRRPPRSRSFGCPISPPHTSAPRVRLLPRLVPPRRDGPVVKSRGAACWGRSVPGQRGSVARCWRAFLTSLVKKGSEVLPCVEFAADWETYWLGHTVGEPQKKAGPPGEPNRAYLLCCMALSVCRTRHHAMRLAATPAWIREKCALEGVRCPRGCVGPLHTPIGLPVHLGGHGMSWPLDSGKVVYAIHGGSATRWPKKTRCIGDMSFPDWRPRAEVWPGAIDSQRDTYDVFSLCGPRRGHISLSISLGR